MVRVTEGCEIQAGAGEEPREECGAVQHPPEPSLHQGAHHRSLATPERPSVVGTGSPALDVYSGRFEPSTMLTS